ncbi:hypothetical protein [Streptomyces sp. NPDC051677]|uniref:hypothetical protein n=1 Tax=Streptomyces sp. NPDC051677 TaxID=3365669 RepID=UPI0037CD6CED
MVNVLPERGRVRQAMRVFGFHEPLMRWPSTSPAGPAGFLALWGWSNAKVFA